MSKPLYEPWTVRESDRYGNDPPEWYEIVDARNVHLAEMPSQEMAERLAMFPDLLASCKELSEALAGAMRIINKSTDRLIVRRFADEMARLGTADGIGVRAKQAIEKAEGRPG